MKLTDLSAYDLLRALQTFGGSATLCARHCHVVILDTARVPVPLMEAILVHRCADLKALLSEHALGEPGAHVVVSQF